MSRMVSLQNTAGEVATIFVGEDQVPVQADKYLLCSVSDYFRSALNGGFLESSTKILHLPDVTPEMFNIFLLWMYAQPHDQPGMQFIGFNLNNRERRLYRRSFLAARKATAGNATLRRSSIISLGLSGADEISQSRISLHPSTFNQFFIPFTRGLLPTDDVDFLTPGWDYTPTISPRSEGSPHSEAPFSGVWNNKNYYDIDGLPMQEQPITRNPTPEIVNLVYDVLPETSTLRRLLCASWAHCLDPDNTTEDAKKVHKKLNPDFIYDVAVLQTTRLRSTNIQGENFVEQCQFHEHKLFGTRLCKLRMEKKVGLLIDLVERCKALEMEGEYEEWEGRQREGRKRESEESEDEEIEYEEIEDEEIEDEAIEDEAIVDDVYGFLAGMEL
ncbi:hypothetical protein BU24DRAFT_453021 [Aaosphaeria arxii CBS 175.79]|uniref:BTB domain-containing protein n=1 Tax=Aaosphaeria arxii CBS 175.79 TaxID=1450172 RepID=A0A6A5XIJ6_9PLEO|nr:uncharacterized protein BU24DRAFT_453021 [Aaosphaeria arxii CBS 175.79]KAF2012651.1 hypothetical protein BU24DRAFT_453021 [Aaosphaeria arxii CBS 175.79]